MLKYTGRCKCEAVVHSPQSFLSHSFYSVRMPWVPSIIPCPRSHFTSPKCTYVCGTIWQFVEKKQTKPNQEQLLTCTLHVSSLCRALPPVHGGLLKAGLVEKCFSVLSFGRAGCRATRFSHHLTLEVRHSESNKEG